MNDTTSMTNRIEMAAEIVSAYVSNNSLPAGELPALLQAVHASLEKIGTGGAVEPQLQAKQPVVPVKKSVGTDFIVCLECGRKFKSLKRHLQTAHGLNPDEYRTKWSLNRSYPMVAPAYANARSTLAKQMGLGQKKTDAAPPAKSNSSSASARKSRGRPKAAASA
ncbi:MAG: MucR family transcriptional regulator [Methylobacteriaceae bacterium]|nr:MucR family transcriptional regulator [Methylobacteriaceae bacterium]MBV9703105.1 MucR family transcriptional regulator [Methylobacteriaceae bacterium]